MSTGNVRSSQFTGTLNASATDTGGAIFIGSEIPELPTQQEIEAELKRRGLPTVSELVAQERDRKAAVTAARPEIQPRSRNSAARHRPTTKWRSAK